MALKMLGPYNKLEEKFFEILVCHSYETLEELTPFHKGQHMKTDCVFGVTNQTFMVKVNINCQRIPIHGLVALTCQPA